MKCAICKDKLDEEHPNSTYGVNPESFRKAWMHLRCFINAFDILRNTPSKCYDFDNRLDEYITKFL